MQIQFERIRFKNFLSFGDNFAEINLKDFKSTLITGSNFSGKSGSLLDTLNFALFGRAFRSINKPQLVNVYNNKNCLVELEFEKNNQKYLIRRGLKPGIFEIFQNGRQLDILSSVKDQQQEFEKTVLNFSFQTFQQIVVLGSANYVPFMKLKPNDRRAVVDDILNLHIFTRMAEKLKADMSETKTSLQAAENQAYIKNELLKDKRDHLEALQNVNVSIVNEKELKELEVQNINIGYAVSRKKEEMGKIEIDISFQDILDSAEIVQDIIDISSVDDKIKKYESIKEKIMYAVNSQKKNYDFFSEHSTCPTCSQTIEESFRQEKIENLKESMLEKKDGVSDLLNKITEWKTYKKEIEKRVKDIEKRVQEKRNIEAEINRLNYIVERNVEKLDYIQSPKSLDKDKIEKVESEISALDDDLCELSDEVIEYQKLMDIQKNCALLLKDTGIKSTIMNKYLRMLNQNMELFLKRFGLKLNFELDSNFNENITNFSGHSFSYFSLSEGEKLRVDLAMMFSWRNIASKRAKMKTNMLILDEVMDGAADGFLQQELISLLNDLAHTNVFVISHRVDGLLDKFDRNLHVERKVGFSEIQERTL